MSSLRRYTSLAATIHLLNSKRVTLLDPKTWDDKNDAYFMAKYKRLKNAETVLALCFAEKIETYHHWKVFSNGLDGVRIKFDKDMLLSTFEKDSNINHRRVDYKLIKDVSSQKSIELEDLPFLKRRLYKDEGEYRVVYVNKKIVLESKDYPIEIEWIEEIQLSPWMPKTLVDSVKKTFKKIDGCSHLKIFRSTIVESESWKKITTRVSP